MPYVETWNNIIGLNTSFVEKLKEADKTCGYADYRDKYFTFPASGLQPPVPDIADGCDINGMASNAAFNVNPCFNSYEINTQCPIPSGKIHAIICKPSLTSIQIRLDSQPTSLTNTPVSLRSTSTATTSRKPCTHPWKSNGKNAPVPSSSAGQSAIPPRTQSNTSFLK